MPTETDDYDYGSGVPGALLRKITITYASLGNITAFPQTVTTYNGGGTQIALTTFNYDETTVTTTSGTPQHVSVSGSRGNLTSINYPVSGLTAHSTYYDTGTMHTTTDVNGAVTTFNYSSSSCGNSFPTSVSEPLSLSRSMTWNCTGGVQLTSSDENNQPTTATYNDAYFWRPASVADPTGATTALGYAVFGSFSDLTFNGGASDAESATGIDGLGRPIEFAHLESLSGPPYSYDQVVQSYDSVGRLGKVYMPCVDTTSAWGPSNWTCNTPYTSYTYDALNRPLQTTDGGGGTVSYSYTGNDAFVTIGPAASGENTKRRQLEYDALGRLTSVCEITSASGSGACGQNSPQTGYWTKYTYDALGNLTGVTQNAQPGGTAQARNYSFDALRRLTSETNAESGTTSYTYDSATGCTGTFSGDLVKRVDALGDTSCFTYDALHRNLSVTYPSGSYASVTPSKYFVYDTATVNSVVMTNAKSRLAEAYTCFSPCSSKTTDLGFSYTARGEATDVYELTPHSSPSYYHVSQTYWPHGAPSQLSSNITGLPTISYGGTIGSTVGLDGEGRITQVTAASGQNPVTGVTYNNSSLPTQVTFGSADTDIFAYDFNTMRKTQYQFNINGQSSTGTLTWNANATLGQLAITDQFNGADTQTCNYVHDDLTRIASANCGTAASQTFSYDPFGNISKSGSPYTFQPTYNSTTNRFATIPGTTPSYDANGNVLSDGSHTYAWDADGNSVTLDSVGLTFDALDRMVEQNRSGTYTEIVYSPGGAKLALMSGQTLQKAFVPLPGQATAVYTSSGLDHYRHSDWLGSSRLTSSPSRTVLSTTAYAPFSEAYAQSGTADLSFTGQNPDTVSGDYDFLYREYSNQGRWASPDPAGLAAVDITNPQSWNRYAYVGNNPLNFVDPSGLGPACDRGDASCNAESRDAIFSLLACRTWGCGDDSCFVNGFAASCGMATTLVQQDLGFTCLYGNCSGYGTQWSTVGEHYLWLASQGISLVPGEEGEPYFMIADGNWVDLGPVGFWDLSAISGSGGGLLGGSTAKIGPGTLTPPPQISFQRPTTFWQRLAVAVGCTLGLDAELMGPETVPSNGNDRPESKFAEGKYKVPFMKGTPGRPPEMNKSGKSNAQAMNAAAGGAALVGNQQACLQNASGQR